MGQDFTKGLNVCIGNYGYYNEGSLHDAWITLPKTEAEIRDFLHLNQLQDSQHEEIYISDYDGIPFGTRLLFNEFCHLEDLNLLAKQLVTANPADLEKVGAWIQANDTPESLVGLMNLIEQADDIPFYSWGYDGAYDKDEFGNMIYTTMSPERNYGYEMVEQNEELKHILDSSSQIESAFDYEKYGRAYTEGGEVTVLEDGYIDNCADGPDVDYYDRDELASLIGDRYDAKYPATSSKAADRSLGHKQEVSRNASELLNDGKQAMENSIPGALTGERHMEPYRESPLHGLTCRGLSLFRKIGLCAFSVEPLMTGLAFDGFGIQTLLHLESNGIEDFLFRAP